MFLIFLSVSFHWECTADLDLQETIERSQCIGSGFDKEGRLSWELRAIEVAPRSDKLYETLKP